MGIFNWFRERREFAEEKELRVQKRLRSEEPALLDSLSSIFTGLGGGIHQVGRIEAEVVEQMKRERRQMKLYGRVLKK